MATPYRPTLLKPLKAKEPQKLLRLLVPKQKVQVQQYVVTPNLFPNPR